MRQLIIVTAALLLAGCDSGPDLACVFVEKSGPPPTHQCSELDGLDPTQQKDAVNACAVLGGAIVESCAAQGQIGVCRLISNGANQAIFFYADGGLTAAQGEASCKELAGTWTGS